jgi:hypothetical protein
MYVYTQCSIPITFSIAIRHRRNMPHSLRLLAARIQNGGCPRPVSCVAVVMLIADEALRRCSLADSTDSCDM